MIRATTFSGKAVAVFGLGGSGIAAIQSLRAGGALVSAWDDSEAGREAGRVAGAALVDLSQADWSQFSSLVLAPGVPLTHPEPHWTVTKAKAAGVEIIGDIEVFARERAAQAPQAPFIAITGTNGKSTTTALIAHILRFAGKSVDMGGNIGRAILTLEPPFPNRFHVVEMSSYQIDLTPSLKPTIGVMLNVTPDHLDRHGSLNAYAAVKERLVQAADIACIGVDDEHSIAMLKRKTAAGFAVAFSAFRSIAPGYSVLDGEIICSNREGLAVKLGRLRGVSTLRGAHNAQNALAAVAAVRECLNALGEPADLDWSGALASFPGLPHRLEQVGAVGRTIFINDSKATNADSTEKALLSFPNDVFWIAGGRAKEGGIDSLLTYLPGVAKVYLIGEASDAFAEAIGDRAKVQRCGALDAAVSAAARDAAASAAKQPVVLLSPACASFDQFRNFEVRGDAFRDLVSKLPGVKLGGATCA